MFLVLIAAMAGAALSILLRGGTTALLTDLRAAPALVLGVLGLIVAEWLPVPGRPGIYIVATVLMVVGLVQNLQISGAVVTAIGLFLTGFVVLINGFLPLSLDGADAKNLDATGLRQIETADTRLAVLGDVVPIPLGPWVVSFGDLIATAGAFIFTRNLLGREEEEGLDADTFLAQFLEVDGKPIQPVRSARTEQPVIDLRTEESPSWSASKTAAAPPPPTEADRFA